jgi:hypothetical protein
MKKQPPMRAFFLKIYMPIHFSVNMREKKYQYKSTKTAKNVDITAQGVSRRVPITADLYNNPKAPLREEKRLDRK